MSVIYMYHSQDPDFGGMCGLGQNPAVAMLDHFCSLYGGQWECIHPGGYKTHCSTNHLNLQAAYEAHPDHLWVHLDSKGEVNLREFQHPVDNVVYVVGHDYEGFRGEDLIGPVVRIENARNDERESFAVACLIMVICNRWSRPWQ
jgi:hypothetical protein